MENLYYRLKVELLAMENEIFCYSWKEHLTISRIVKFGGEMFQNTENIASPVKFAYICITRGKFELTIAAKFELKLRRKWQPFPRVLQICAKFKTSQGHIFRILQHFAIKLCNFANLRILLLAMQ